MARLDRVTETFSFLWFDTITTDERSKYVAFSDPWNVGSRFDGKQCVGSRMNEPRVIMNCEFTLKHVDVGGQDFDVNGASIFVSRGNEILRPDGRDAVERFYESVAGWKWKRVVLGAAFSDYKDLKVLIDHPHPPPIIRVVARMKVTGRIQ